MNGVEFLDVFNIFPEAEKCLSIGGMDNFYAEIGGRMKSVRMALRMTQAQVAEAAGTDSSFYGQIGWTLPPSCATHGHNSAVSNRRGVNVPSLKTFAAIAAALKVNSSDLLPGRSRGKERLYETAVESLLAGLDPKRKALVLGLVKDIVTRHKTK